MSSLSSEDMGELSRLELELRSASKKMASLRSEFDDIADKQNRLNTLLNENLKKRYTNYSLMLMIDCSNIKF